MVPPPPRNVGDRMLAAFDSFAEATLAPRWVLLTVAVAGLVSAAATFSICYFFLLAPAGFTFAESTPGLVSFLQAAAPWLAIALLVGASGLFWGWMDARARGYWENPFELLIILWCAIRAGFDSLRERSHRP